jgi:hypothetical protein
VVTRTAVGQPDPGEVEAEFQRVMRYAADQARTYGVEEEAMAALYDVLDEAARCRDETGERERRRPGPGSS